MTEVTVIIKEESGHLQKALMELKELKELIELKELQRLQIELQYNISMVGFNTKFFTFLCQGITHISLWHFCLAKTDIV